MRKRGLLPGFVVCLCLCWFASAGQLAAQAPQNQQEFLKNYSGGPSIFPNVLSPYKQHTITAVGMENSKRLHELIHDGELELSMSDALALAIENNLDILVERFLVPMAQTDTLRTKSGSAARGFSGASIPLGLSAGAIGAGVTTSVAGGGVGNVGGISGGGGAVSVASVGTFDPTINYNFSWDRTSSPLNTLVVAGIPAVTTNSTSYSGSLTQYLPEGTSYFYSLNALRASSTQESLLFNPDVATRMSMGFNQPLLNSFGFLPNERFLIVAKNNQSISDADFRNQCTTTIVQVEDAYWDMATYQENVKVAEQSLAVAQDLYKSNQEQESLGTLSPLDVVSAQSAVASAERDLVVARTNLQLQETQMKNLVARNVDPEIQSAGLVTTTNLPEPRDADIPDLPTAMQEAFAKRSDLQVAEVNVKNENISTAYTASNLLPSVNVFSQYAAAGLTGASPIGLRAPTGAVQSLNQVIDGSFPEYSYGLSMTLPLRNRAAQADNIRAQLETQQTEATLQDLRNQVALSVQQAVIGLVQGKAQVEAAHEATRLARETFQAEQKRLAAGVSTTYNVILQQRNLASAEYAEVQAVDAYAKALVALDQARGGVLERNGIGFNDALSGAITKQPEPPFNVHGFTVGGQ